MFQWQSNSFSSWLDIKGLFNLSGVDVENTHFRVQENFDKFMNKLKSAVLSDKKTRAYLVKEVVLNSLHFGLAQSRKRLYIVGIKRVKGKVMKLPNLKKKSQTVSLQKFLDKRAHPKVDVAWPCL